MKLYAWSFAEADMFQLLKFYMGLAADNPGLN